MELSKEVFEQLAEPFPPELVNWKPQTLTSDKKRGMAVAFVSPRAYIDRLNEVAGGSWSDDYEIHNGGGVVLCRLTILGATRADIGEAEPGDQNTATSAIAQAFKRACVKFGLGAYLYKLPKLWMDYDQQKRSFTPAALAELADYAAGKKAQTHTGGGTPPPQPERPLWRETGNKPIDNPVKILYNVRGYAGWQPKAKEGKGSKTLIRDHNREPITDQTRQHVQGCLAMALGFQGATEKELKENALSLLKFMLDVSSTEALTEQEGKAILFAWGSRDGGINEYATSEANLVLSEALGATDPTHPDAPLPGDGK